MSMLDEHFRALCPVNGVLDAVADGPRLSNAILIAAAQLPANDQLRLWVRGIECHFPEVHYLSGAADPAGAWTQVLLDPMKPFRSQRA